MRCWKAIEMLQAGCKIRRKDGLKTWDIKNLGTRPFENEIIVGEFFGKETLSDSITLTIEDLDEEWEYLETDGKWTA